MDLASLLVRMFTTNHWVTGEVWYEAEDVIAMLGRFDIGQALPNCLVDIWITNVLKLLRSEIEAMLRYRDQIIAHWEAVYPGKNTYEDRGFEPTSLTDISVEKRIKEVDKAF